jgi:plastocyanin
MGIRTGALITGTLLLMVALLFLAGCTSASPSHAPEPPSYTPQTTILIGSEDLNPPVLVIDRGVTITWLNLDEGIHTVISDNGDPDSFVSPSLQTNNQYQFTFTIPGTYGYHCTGATELHGTVIVKP